MSCSKSHRHLYPKRESEPPSSLSHPPHCQRHPDRVKSAAYGGKGWSQTLGVEHGTLVMRAVVGELYEVPAYAAMLPLAMVVGDAILPPLRPMQTHKLAQFRHCAA